MNTIRLSHPTKILDGHISLDGSKSISNRVLIIRALCPEFFAIENLSSGDDTEAMADLLSATEKEVYDVGHGGTTFRFLTAYLAIKQGTQILTGSDRMKERPIGPLVEALRKLGCKIDYIEHEGYPPLRIYSPQFDNSPVEVSIDSGISSQYISALALIAPTLPGGLRIILRGDMVSESYLLLTLAILSEFGVQTKYANGTIVIPNQPYLGRDFKVEADWSAASYHFSLVALARQAEIRLEGIFEKSHQGDSGILSLAADIGVDTSYRDDYWHLSKTYSSTFLSHNFINEPDIAQTLAVLCSAKNIDNRMTGLQTLSIKETDRISALDTELQKINSAFNEIEPGIFKAHPGVQFSDIPRFETYKDHRMAMSFAPLALLHPIEINNPDVVTKSYPAFWKDLESLGFEIQKI